jgi:hypothetical protein
MEIFGSHPQLQKWVEIGTASTSVVIVVVIVGAARSFQ